MKIIAVVFCLMLNAKGQDVVMKGKTYKRTIMANANAQIVVPLDKKYTIRGSIASNGRLYFFNNSAARAYM